MVDEDVPEDGEVGVEGGDLPKVRPEGGAEPAQGGGGVELGDLALDLLGKELSLEIWGWGAKLVSMGRQVGQQGPPAQSRQGLRAEGRVSQCSCLPVRIRPSLSLDSRCLASGAGGATLSAAASAGPSSGGGTMTDAQTAAQVRSFRVALPLSHLS